MTRRALSLAPVVIALATSCGSDFDAKSSVKTVRVLAVRSDLPYARPGETVKLEALVHDARPPGSGEPLKMYWFPAPCIDPPTGQYFACYPGFEAIFPTKVDLTPYLVADNSTSIAIPADALARFQPRPGRTDEPTATAFVFFMACAGHVERVGRPTNQDPNAVPVGCFSGGARLGQEHFIFGFTRVFVFATRRNAVPTTSGILRDGTPIDPKAPLVIPPCAKEVCDKVELDLAFDDAISEIDPENIGPEGQQGRETIYVDWFTTLGKMGSDRRILYDPFLGRPPKTRVEFEPPRELGTGKLWGVLHDNRGGVTWIETALEIK